MQLAAYIARFAAILSGSFGYVVPSKQCNVVCERPLAEEVISKIVIFFLLLKDIETVQILKSR